MWMSFIPSIPSAAVNVSSRWEIDVMGHAIDPRTVARRGTRHKHAVWSGVTLAITHATGKSSEETRKLFIETLDTPLISPGDTKHLLRFNDKLPDVAGGMHANIMNNLWGTAFPQWYDDDGL